MNRCPAVTPGGNAGWFAVRWLARFRVNLHQQPPSSGGTAKAEASPHCLKPGPDWVPAIPMLTQGVWGHPNSAYVRVYPRRRVLRNGSFAIMDFAGPE